MNTFIDIKNYIDQELDRLDHPVTKDIRNISKKIYQNTDHQLAFIINICNELLKTQQWNYKTIAFDLIYKVKKQYQKETFSIFESWLFDYVNDWGDCDDFCTHAFGYLLMIYPEFFARILTWKDHPKFAVRRATAVILIYAIKKDQYKTFDLLLVSDLLMKDDHYLVLKGYGWMLKVLSQKDPFTVYKYLEDNHQEMPRVAFRYALEKLNETQKKLLMML